MSNSDEALTAVRAAEKAAAMTGRPFCVYVDWSGELQIGEFDPARVNDMLEVVHPPRVEERFGGE